jgi:flagellar protein FliO/FliZ
VIELVLRIGFSLLVVLGLMWGLARLVRRPLAGRGGGAVAVLARQQLGRSASVAVVRVVDRALVLGVTEGQISLLGEADLAALEQATEPSVHRKAVGLTATAPGAAACTEERSDEGRLRRTSPGARASGASAGPMAGSVLSPATWRQTMDFLRERTVRH